MLFTIIGAVAIALAGFGVGRIKNAGKLASIKAELDAIESKASADVKALIAKIRSWL